MRSPFCSASCLFIELLLLGPYCEAAQHAAPSGTVNYFEGEAHLGSQPLSPGSIGTAEVDPGQTITTGNGKVELLLMPGVFLRLGESSSVTMIAVSLASTRLSLNHGEAFVEVAEIHPETDLRIQIDGIYAELEKPGLYNFNANLRVIRVLDGQALVYDVDKTVTLRSGHMVNLASAPLKAQKFDMKELEGEELYRWTSLRSAYLAEANADYAPKYMYGGFGWFGDGWYWDPWFDAYTFLPSDGVFYSPFGWGFYSPFCVYTAPFFWGSHYYHHFNPNYTGRWGNEAHYGLPMNYGRGVHYASSFSAHGSSRFGKWGGFRGNRSHGFKGTFHSSGGFHGFGSIGHAGGGGGGHK